MQTRLSRWCDAFIEAGWLAALIVTPVFFNTYSSRVFEPDKLHLLRSLALLMIVAWVVQLLDMDWRRGPGEPGLWDHIRHTPLVLPTLILVLAYLISTALSVVPRISLMGSYVRLQGTFTFLSYIAIFALVLTHLRTRAQVNRIFYTVILSSLPISIYGLIQHFGLDPLPWGGDVRTRVAANMGNSIFVAAFLIMAFFLTLERLISSVARLLSVEKGSTSDALRAGAYLFVLAVQVIAIIFTKSRGPQLGWLAGLAIFGLLGILLLARWAVGQPRSPRWLGKVVRPAWFSLIGLMFVGIAFLVVFNIPSGPLAGLRSSPYIGRMSTLLTTESGTNAVRVLIWEGVVDMMLRPHPPIEKPDGEPDTLNAIRPLVGYGPESMWVAFNRFYPPELAHVELRNASPDRSHNETFDALVRTGALGFGAQLFLYGSGFYFALRWLGLIRGRGRRNLFLGLLVGGALLGVLLPVMIDGSLRLAGIGLPAGLIAGVIVYVALDLLLTPAAGVVTGDQVAGTGSRQLLILAILSAIVAHFVEIHTGIAIASTLTYFWLLAAVLVVAGMGWLDEVQAAEKAAAPERSEANVTERSQVAASKKGGRSKKDARQAELPRPATTSHPSGRTARLAWQSFLPYVGIGMLVTLVLTWDYLINQTGARSAFAALWNAFTMRIDPSTGTAVRSPMLLVLMLFTWVVGGLLALGEHFAEQPTGSRYTWGKNAGLYLAATIGTWLIYGLIQGSRTVLSGLQGLAVFQRIANHIVVFDLALLAGILLLAAAVRLADARPRPARWFNSLPVAPVAGGAVLAAVATLIIINANVRQVRADALYKNGLAYENSRAWESAVVLYNEAARLEPQEDYYYLFLGRALLEYAAGAQRGEATLPVDLSNVPTSDLLPMVERALRSQSWEDLTRATHAVLTGAQRLNPYNTDHAANLARLFRSWAFGSVLNPGETPTNAGLRQLAAERPDEVDLGKLDRSLEHYRQATRLSPQNAQLWNEMAAVQYIKGDTPAALASLDHSLALDRAYYQTYLLRGDMLADAGDKLGALEAYRQAAALRPNDVSVLSAIGVYSAQTGDVNSALQAFDNVIALENRALGNAQEQLASLDATAEQSGGYDRLGQAAKNRRDSLQNSLNAHRSQLHVNYRNKALVLRDAGRFEEAIDMARLALEFANDAQRPTIEQLIAELQERTMTG